MSKPTRDENFWEFFHVEGILEENDFSPFLPSIFEIVGLWGEPKPFGYISTEDFKTKIDFQGDFKFCNYCGNLHHISELHRVVIRDHEEVEIFVCSKVFAEDHFGDRDEDHYANCPTCGVITFDMMLKEDKRIASCRQCDGTSKRVEAKTKSEQFDFGTTFVSRSTRTERGLPSEIKEEIESWIIFKKIEDLKTAISHEVAAGANVIIFEYEKATCEETYELLVSCPENYKASTFNSEVAEDEYLEFVRFSKVS